jgi:hypothetical protein
LRDEDDPLDGMVNLFDLWMVFSIALLIVVASSSRQRGTRLAQGADSSHSKLAPEVSLQQARAIQHDRFSREKRDGSGERLGTAFRLASGEVVCVPDPLANPPVGVSGPSTAHSSRGNRRPARPGDCGTGLIAGKVGLQRRLEPATLPSCRSEPAPGAPQLPKETRSGIVFTFSL